MNIRQITWRTLIIFETLDNELAFKDKVFFTDDFKFWVDIFLSIFVVGCILLGIRHQVNNYNNPSKKNIFFG